MKSFCIAVCYCFLLVACNSGNNKPKNTPATDNQGINNEVVHADQSDLLEVLQGNWQSETDAGYRIEIVGEKIRHFNQGKLSAEATIHIDVNCSDPSCKTSGSDTSEGWCFTETDNQTTQCNLVLKCDATDLQYAPIGAANPTLSFKKVK